ncbi:hypothetical protein J7U46_10530 [Pelomonas sp. V22]|uniref:hypothetical protein n=1 Tax=Pelomonas sp. V22 TaxID=2822139 RepID=UPI0024A7B5A5|nr:hypothetical protein [Pelomonas sp. V22]MDI4633485.1 hypothetical protein [Pelomonas sp. V22]
MPKQKKSTANRNSIRNTSHAGWKGTNSSLVGNVPRSPAPANPVPDLLQQAAKRLDARLNASGLTALPPETSSASGFVMTFPPQSRCSKTKDRH